MPDLSTLERSQFLAEQYRHDFPILLQSVHGHPLSYLDNASSTQKPNTVINAVSEFYQQDNANIHRGIHQLSERATLRYEKARHTVKQFINAAHTHEVIFTQGTTDGINLIANSYLLPQLQSGDEILLTMMEHHSNIVPWQQIAKQQGAIIKVVAIDDKGQLDWDDFCSKLSDKTKLMAVTHISNVLGTINPIRAIVDHCHAHNVAVCVDGAQAVAHQPVDVQKLDCDFYVFSGHKLFAPTGIGVLYAKQQHLANMQPYQTGGGMIETVSFEKSTFLPAPYGFEAGTPPIAQAIGLAAAIDYLSDLDWTALIHHEQQLLRELRLQLNEIKDIECYGMAGAASAVVSFNIKGVHAHDVSTILDRHGIAVRAGHHCCMPLMRDLKVPATARASFAFYNTRDDLERFLNAITEVKKVFHV